MATPVKSLLQATDTLAAHTGRTKAYYLAAEVLERVRKGQESVHSAADVRKDLGLGD